MPTVTAPNGDTVVFPDGTDDATINSEMAKAYPGQAATANSAPDAAGQPDQSGTLQAATGTSGSVQPTNWGAGYKLGEALPVINTMQAFKGGLSTFIPKDTLDQMDRAGNWVVGGGMHTTEELKQNYEFDQDHLNPDPGGEMVGKIVGTAPIALATRNPWVGGALSGAATTNPDHPTVQSVATDTGMGLLTGGALGMGMNTLGKVVNPMVRGAVQRLIDEGVPLTPGQITGGMLQGAENWLRSAPLVGDLIHNAQDASLTGFNRAAVQRVLDPIGARLPDGMVGHDAVAYAQQAMDDRYASVLPTLNIRTDVPFAQAGRNIMRDANTNLPRDQYQQFYRIVSAAQNRFNPGGTMTGRTMQEVDTALGQQYRLYAKNGGADGAMAQYLRQYQGELRDMVARSNPGAAPILRGMRQGWGILARVEQASGGAGTDASGRFNPGQLKSAISTQDITARNRSTAAGRQPLQDLASDAQDVLGRTLPAINSFNRMIAGGGGALAAFASHFNPLAAAPALAVAAPYTRIGGNMARAALTSRPASAAGIRALVDAVAPHVAVAGAANAPKYKAPAVVAPADDPFSYSGH